MIIISLKVAMKLYLPRKVITGDKGIGTGGHIQGPGSPYFTADSGKYKLL